ncbi:MAG TPA: nucleoside triphosphate pyrophosphatase [candidate division Zixibacteria bacterium]|nr:nucleoside triphosphate pyrophosphatase [candidate division Zixibacteria bacterium]
MKKIILASASPRRHELLNLLHIEHEVIPCDEKEEKLINNKFNRKITENKKTTEEQVLSLAFHKVSCVAKTLEQMKITDGIIIGADTIVILEGEIIGKPNSKNEAIEILEKLSGKIHEVYTGICLYEISKDKIFTGIEKTNVSMVHWSKERLEKYIEEEYIMDKAGAYAIQGIGAAMIDRIEGCFYNVMGLPLSKLVKMLDEAGFQLIN